MSNQRQEGSSRSGDSAAAALTELKHADPDRFLQVLFAPPRQRAAVLALASFNLELARVADLIREPMAGLIRLQWWRDALTAAAAGHPPTHPVLAAMVDAQLIDTLGAPALAALVDAREVEVDATPLKRLADLEAHTDATAGALNGELARLLGAPPPTVAAARTVGTAYGLLGIVRAVPFVARRAQPLLPEEPLAAQGLTAERLGGDDLAALRPVLADISERARHLLAGVKVGARRRHAAPFVLAVLARQDLARLARRDFDVFDGRLTERPPWTAARCLIAVTLGR